MSNQANPDKVKLQVWLDRGLMARLDGEVARRGLTRAAITADAVRAYLDGSAALPATRDDLAALRDQVTALTEFSKAQAIALMDGVQRAIEAAPVQALPSGVPEDEHERLLAARDDEITVLRDQLKEMHRSRQASAQALSERIDEAVGAERERGAGEIGRLQELLAGERELSHSLGEQVKALRCELEAERGRVADEVERRRGEIGFDGYMRGLEDCRRANPVKRLLGRF